MDNKETKKILLLCGASQTVITFRLGFIRALKKVGYSVVAVALDEEYRKDIEDQGIEFYSVNTYNRSLNPFGMIKLQQEYNTLIRQISPDIVFTFMLKPNIFGVRAAKKAGIKKIFSMVEGLGDVFINNGLKWKLIRAVVCCMYRRSFNNSNKVFFLNNDDQSEFLCRKLVKKEQCVVIPGIGVDLDYFSYKPINNYKTFLMIARMLKTKGVEEYCQAARLVKQKYPDAVFNYLGAEGTVKITDIQEYIDDGSINYLGTTKDVRPYLEACSVYVLPSYREGMPMSIMEAEAVGRGIITTNVAGCCEVVNSDINGLIVQKEDINGLADAMIKMLDDVSLIIEYGENSRKMAIDKFDINKINSSIVGILDL